MKQLVNEVDSITGGRHTRYIKQKKHRGRWAVIRFACAYFGGLLLVGASAQGLSVLFASKEFSQGSPWAALGLFVLLASCLAGGAISVLVGVPLSMWEWAKVDRAWEYNAVEIFERLSELLLDEQTDWMELTERGRVNNSIRHLANHMRKVPIVIKTTERSVVDRVDRVVGGILTWQPDVAMASPDWRSDMLDVVKAAHVHFLIGKWQMVADGDPSPEAPTSLSKWQPRLWVIGGVILYLAGVGLAIWAVNTDNASAGTIVVAATLLFASGGAFLGRAGVQAVDLKGSQEVAKNFGIAADGSAEVDLGST